MMQRNSRLIKSIILISLVLGLAGCASEPKSIFPEGDMTMAQIYNQQTGSGDSSGAVYSVQQIKQALPQLSTKPEYVAYTQTAQNQTTALFKPLPNPSIPLYIYPHLVKMGADAVPVPGYTTSFFLYDQNNYTLPSEGGF